MHLGGGSGSADSNKPDQMISDTNEVVEQLKKKTEEAERKLKEVEEIKASLQEQMNKLEQVIDFLFYCFIAIFYEYIWHSFGPSNNGEVIVTNIGLHPAAVLLDKL